MKEHAMAPQDSSEANNRGSINWDDDEVEQAPSEGGEERQSIESGEDENGDIQIGEIGMNGWSWAEFRKFLGAAWLVSIAYLDPGNLETDLQGGAQFGYALGWVLLWSSLLGVLVQILSLRLGIVSQRNLAQMCRDEYPVQIRWILWIMAEFMIVASDVPEVVGTAFALQILSSGFISLTMGVIIAGGSTLIFLALSALGKTWLELFVGMLVGIIGLCFMLECVSSSPDMSKTIAGMIIPRVPAGSENIAVGLLGAVVMPHNLFLQSALVQSRPVRRSKTSIEYACLYTSVETTIALVTSFFVNLSVMLVASASFAPSWCEAKQQVCQGGTDVCDEPCLDVGLQTASSLLQRILGARASVLWGVALLASGQSSTITGTYAGQFVMEGFVRLACPLWVRNLISRSIAVVPSLVVVLLAGAEGANYLVVFSSVVLSMHLPFALIPLLRFTDSPLKMGKLKNSRQISWLLWTLSSIVVIANAALVYINVVSPMVSSSSTGLEQAWKVGIVLLCCALYGSLGFYLMVTPVKKRVELPDGLEEIKMGPSEALDAPFLT